MTSYQLSDYQISNSISNDLVVLEFNIGVYYSLNETGSFVYNAIKCGLSSFDSILSSMLQYYDVNEETCKSDLTEILNSLVDKKLVVENIIA